MTLLIVAAEAFVAVTAGTLVMHQVIFGERIKMKKRVTAVIGVEKPVPIRQQELSAPLYQRAIKPLLSQMSFIMTKALPVVQEETIYKKLVRAGNPGNLAPREFIVIKYLLAGITGLVLWYIFSLLGKSSIQNLVLGVLGLVIGWLLPDFIVTSNINRRKEEIEKQLPDVLDFLTVSVEAGLGFDGALMKVVEKFKGILADEFLLLLQEIKLGKLRREALREMADRIGVDDFSNFVGSLILADQLGVSIGNVLRLQAKDVRTKRRQRIEEMAMKAPIKMLFPLVFCIFPTLFVVLLGPAFLQIMKLFAK
jgi:tight adherence protein C